MKKILLLVFAFFVVLPVAVYAGTNYKPPEVLKTLNTNSNNVYPNLTSSGFTNRTSTLTDGSLGTCDSLSTGLAYYGAFGTKKVIDGYNIISGAVTSNGDLYLYDQNKVLIQTISQPISANYTTTSNVNSITPTNAYFWKFVNDDASARGFCEISFTELPDTFPPAIPGNFTATGNNMSITLNWTKPTDSDLDGYKIYKNGNLLTDITNETLTTYTENNVSPGISNAYQITSYDNSPTPNESEKSVIQYATATDTTPPTTPTNLTGTAGDRQVSLNWTASTDNHQVAGYQIFLNGTQIATTTNTNYLVTGLTNNTTYTIGVRAVDVTGNSSTLTSISRTPTDTTPPQLTTPTVTETTETSITITWQPSTSADITEYEVRRNGNLIANYTHTTVTSYSHTFTGLSSGATYSLTVVAIDDDGNKSGRTTSGTTAANPPAVPQGLVITPLDNRLNLNWSDNTESDLATYKVYAQGNNTAVHTITESEKLIDSLINGIEKCYQISAIDIHGNESNKTNAVCGTPIDITPPFDVSEMTLVSWTEYTVTFRWSESTSDDIELYKVYRDNVLKTSINDNGSATYQYTSDFMYPSQVYDYKVNPVDDDNNELLTGNATLSLATVAVPPPKLTGLTATRQNNAIKFDWTDIQNTVTDVTGYKVYKKVGTTYNLIGSPTTNTFTYNTNDTTNSDYVITAVDLGFSESEYSNPVSSKPILAPVKPDNLNILPLDNQLKLTWNDSPGTDVAGYKIFEENNNTALFTVQTNEKTISGLLNGTQKCYQVSTVDIFETESEKTAAVCGTPVDYQPPFDVSNVSFSSSTEYTYTFTWQKIPGEDTDFFNIYKEGTILTTVDYVPGQDNYEYTATNLTPGVVYVFQVVPVDDDFNETTNGTGVINVSTVGVPPAAPTGLTDIKGVGKINFSWNASIETDFDYYKIYKKVNGSYQFIANATTNSFELTTNDETPTDYAVTAVDDGGTESGYSNKVTTNALPTTPPETPNPYEGFMNPITANSVKDSSVSLLSGLKWFILIGLVVWFVWMIIKSLLFQSVDKKESSEEKPKRRKRTKREREQEKKQREKIRAEKKRVSALQREVRKKVQKSVGYKIYK